MPLVYAGSRIVEEPSSDAHERARKIRPELTRGELVKVGFARHQAEAELMQNLLIEEGIPSVVRRSAGADVPDFLAAGPRDVLVPESGVDLARETLQQAEIEPALAGTAQAPSRGQVARIVIGVLVGAAAAALIAWALIQAAS